MQYFYPLLTFLSKHPLAAMIIALMFVIPIFFPRYIIRQKIVLIWLIYGYWEVFLAQWKPELTDVATRPDIVFIVPLLLISFSFGLVTIIKGFMRKCKPTDSCSI